MLLNDWSRVLASLFNTSCAHPKAGSTEVSAILNTHICDLEDVLNDPKEIMLVHDGDIVILLVIIHHDHAISWACT